MRICAWPADGAYERLLAGRQCVGSSWLTARIDRLGERLRKGDPDMEPDEIKAALDRAEENRRELQEQLPESKRSAVLVGLPLSGAAGERGFVSRPPLGQP